MASSFSFSQHLVSFSFLIFLFITFYLNPIQVYSRSIPPNTNTKFIKTSCSSTTYPKLCFASLAKHASLIQRSPKLLTHAALNATLETAKSTSAIMSKLSKSSSLNPREVAATQDCIEELSDAVDELRRSIGEMGQISRSNFQVMINDIQTWVSAALTDETTCSDGFEGNTENGKIIRKQIVAIAHMTSNALALINNFASLQG